MFLKKFFIALSFAWLVLGPAVVLAQPDIGVEYGAYTGLSSTDVRIMTARVIRAAMGVLGIACVVIVIYAGFLWMTSGGNEDNAATAKKWLFGAVLGLIVIFAAYSITTFVTSRVLNATSSDFTSQPNP